MTNFTVTATGGFSAPDGNPWTFRGLNAGVQDALSGFGNLQADFPGITAIRLNCNPNTDSAADIAKVVQEYTAAGIVVEVEDHSGNGANVAWYTQMASAFKGNPLVFLETPNEPTTNATATAQNQINIINAVHATGFSNPIGVQPVGGWDQSNIPLVTAALGNTGLFVTPHIYYNGNDPNGGSAYVQTEIATAHANGLFPVIDEFGNAIDGFTQDPNGNNVITSVIAANESGQAGAAFWAMDNNNHPNGADSAFLTPDGSQLTPVGITYLQPWLSQTTGGLTPTPPVVTPPTFTPSPNDTIIHAVPTPSIIDANGNEWTITCGGQVSVNGMVDTRTANVTEMAYVDDKIWQENTAKLWYSETTPNGTWTPGTTTSPLPATTPNVVPQIGPAIGTTGPGPAIVGPVETVLPPQTMNLGTMSVNDFLPIVPTGQTISTNNGSTATTDPTTQTIPGIYYSNTQATTSMTSVLPDTHTTM